MKSTSLMFELSHPERLKILKLLSENPMRLSELSKRIDVTTAEVSRHMDRLIKARLIDKSYASYYNLTRFAYLVLSEYSNIDFLANNVDFFLSHNLNVLPPELKWFNSMSQGEMIEGTLEITSLMWEYNRGAEEYINVISDQVMRALVDITCKKIDDGVMVRKIYPKNTDFPKEYLVRNGKNHEIRLLDEIPLALIITDKSTGMCLRGENGHVDFSISLSGQKESFRKWTNAVFDYFWKKAKPLL